MSGQALATPEKTALLSEHEELMTRIKLTTTARRLTIGIFAAVMLGLRVLAGVEVPTGVFAALAAWFGFSFVLDYFVEVDRRRWHVPAIRRPDAWTPLATGATPDHVPRYAGMLADPDPIDPHRALENRHVAYLVLELTLATVVVHYLGGVGGLGILLYLVVILFANMFLPRVKGMAVTLLGSAFFSGLAAAEFLGVIRPQPFFAIVRIRDLSYLVTMIAALPMGLFPIFGYSVSIFSDALQRKSIQLQAMFHQLQGYVEELARHKTELEDTVAARTRDLQAAYDELKHAHRELQALDEMKSSFLANVSHELRTPLTSIRSFSEILLTYPDEDRGSQLEFIQIINHESERLTRLINDVLDVAKIESGRMEWHLAEVRLDELLHEAARTARPLLADAGLEFSLRIDSGDYLVEADRDRISQVLGNLLNNALKFTKQGEVALALCRVGNVAEIVVRDTGVGIPADKLGKIFDKFYQVSEEGRLDGAKTAGTGLGLAICKEIVEHHGGRLWVESELGVGSAFHFTIRCLAPRLVARAEAAVGRPDAVGGSSRKAGNASPVVMVVDDEPGIRRSLRVLLEREGYGVVEAGSGREAIELCKQHRPDLITMDVLLPDASGFNVLEELKNRPSTADIPVVMVSVVDDRERGAALGASGYVMKPVDLRELSRRVRALLTPGPHHGKILVVDDDDATARSIEAALLREGYQAARANNADEALRFSRRERPDLIISDLLMPGVSGFDLLRTLRQDPITREIPVVVLTGHTDRETRVTALSLGADRFIAKDEGLASLLAQIRDLMDMDGRAD
ncbi:MAG TPA: response regulator [Bacillota bacterium]|nr:response regulator [Bacillota bacterium]